MNLKPETLRQIEEVIPHYPVKRSATLPLLHLIQEDIGYIPPEAIDWIAAKLELQPINVYEVVTFYPMFRQKPIGRRHIKVCRTLSCALRGSEGLLHHCEKRLKIHAGETTPDGKVTLRTAECLASCGTAPMMQVDKTYHENLTTQRVDEILDELLAQ